MSTTTTTTTSSRAAAAAFHQPTLIKKKKKQKFAPRKAAPAFSARALKKRAQLRGIGLVTQSELDDGGNSSLGKATTSAAEVGDDSDEDDEKSSNQRGASLSSRERLRQALNEEIDGAMREVSRAQTEEERRPAAAASAVAPEKQMRFEEEEDFYVEEERPPRTRRGLEELERRERERRATRTTTRERRVRNDASSSSSSGGRRKSKQQPINNNNSSDVFTLTRSQLMGKEVVTRTSGVRLGQCSQMWVDAENWTVEALAIRQNALTGGVDHVKLSALRQVGDVVLVHDENAVERRWSSYNLSPLIGCDVITEAGAFIGRVRDYEFDPEDGSVKRLIVDAWGISAIPDDVISTYAVDVREVIDAGRERILVEDGCEQRVEQLSASLLQRLELAGTPWEEEEAFLQDPYYNNESSRRGVGRRTTSYYDEYEEEEMIRYEQRRRRQREQQQQSRRREPQRQQQRERRKEGIPLMRPTQSYERMDADGKRGSRPQFDAYLDPVDRPYEYEEISGAPRERRASASRRLDEPSSSSSSSRRRRPASDDYL
ncbi:unnamed protein product [Bathycoccus prasinos]